MEKMRDYGGPAFPINFEHWPAESGLSLRDWFAGQVLGGIIMAQATMLVHGGEKDDEDLVVAAARSAYAHADAMLRERAKE